MSTFASRCTVVVALVVALVAAAGPGGAAGIGLNVDPGKVDIAVAPGGTYNIALIVRNDNDQPTHVQSSTADFRVDEAGQYAYARAGSIPTSLIPWLAINPREFDVAPNSFQQIRLTVQVPPHVALDGEYAGVLFFQTRLARQRSALSFSARIATKVYATIAGTAKAGGEVADMRASPLGDGELYRIVFKNTGNTHVYVNGRLEVRRGKMLVQKIPLPAAMLVERGGDRVVEIGGGHLDPGVYDAVAVLDYGGNVRTGGKIRFDAR
jgi:hypothetical protein